VHRRDIVTSVRSLVIVKTGAGSNTLINNQLGSRSVMRVLVAILLRKLLWP